MGRRCDLTCTPPTWLFGFGGFCCVGQSGRAYNVGSGEAISISSLAHMIANLRSPSLPVRILQQATPSVPPTRYIPDVTRAAEELNLAVKVTLRNSLERTLQYLTHS